MFFRLTLCLVLLSPLSAQARVLHITRDEVRCVTVTGDDGTVQTRCSMRQVRRNSGAVELPPPLQPVPVPKLEPPPPLEELPEIAPRDLPAPLSGEEIPSAPDGDHADRSPFPPAPAPSRAASTVDSDERAVLDLLNAERARRGLGRLTLDPAASAAARAHSRDMCERRYFSHVSPEGKQPWDRLRGAGARFGTAAENIAVGYRTPAQVHRGWLDSPGHRRNRLHPHYTRAGVGVHRCNGVLYWTELLTRSSPSSSRAGPR